MAKSSGGLILLAGGAAAAYYAYTQGWLSSLFGSSTATPAASPVPASGSAPAPSSLPAPAQNSAGTAATPPTLVIENLGPAGINIPQLQQSLNPSLSPCTMAQIQAAEQGTGIAALYAQQMKAQGASQSSIDNAVAQSLSGAGVCSVPAGGVSGLGRLAVYLPQQRKVFVLPRNYHWKRSVGPMRGAA